MLAAIRKGILISPKVPDPVCCMQKTIGKDLAY